jgi:hypothetical protein
LHATESEDDASFKLFDDAQAAAQPERHEA